MGVFIRLTDGVWGLLRRAGVLGEDPLVESYDIFPAARVLRVAAGGCRGLRRARWGMNRDAVATFCDRC